MRNCFKRYDKANGNIDFNGASAANASGTTPSGAASGSVSKQQNNNGQQQPNGTNTGSNSQPQTTGMQ